MRVLMVHNDYGRPSGEEEAAESIARMLVEHGHEVHWLRKSSQAVLNSRIRQVGAFFAGIHSCSARREVARLVDRLQPDIVQVQNIFPWLSPSIFKPLRLRELPVVMRCPNYRLFCPSGLHLSRGEICERCLGGKEYWCALRNCESNRVKSLGYALRSTWARMSRAILDGVDMFAVLTEFQRQRYLDGGIPASKLAVLPNSFSVDTANAPNRLGTTVSFIGRPAPEKGIEQFLLAARALPHIPFAIAGNPICTPGIENRLPENVTIHGFIAGEALEQFVQETRILVIPSLCFDSFPNVILRAQAAGKPVVASRLGPLPEILVENETGLLYDPYDTEKLVSAIRKLYDDSASCRRFGEQGQRRAITEFSQEACFEKLIALYNRARETKRRRHALGASKHRAKAECEREVHAS
ncbi:MAG: glycosyltransferase family 4 protein [Planctomycetales bacterium]|nr:glycosyltransferase family 4 protein [Planctomycetales bacterium]